MEKRAVILGVRLTEAEYTHLTALAARSGRTKSDVVRLLLAQASVGRPDIWLRELPK